MKFNHETFFSTLRGGAMFGSSFDQQQVDGLETLLTNWENYPEGKDIRHFAYMLATTFHETSATMQPIEEYGKGSGMEYGKKDPQTGQTYYGRGYVQLTWRDNYARADKELGLSGDASLEWHASNALKPDVAARTMAFGMEAGWFRSGEKLDKYFNDVADDPYGAREIINGDKTKMPSWSNGRSIGNLIKDYHNEFLNALKKSQVADVPAPTPPPEPAPGEYEETLVTILRTPATLKFTLPKGSKVEVV